MQPRISLVTLGVMDFNRALKFYRDDLGWKAQVQDDVAFFPLNGIVLGLLFFLFIYFIFTNIVLTFYLQFVFL